MPAKDIRQVSSRVVCQNLWMTLREDQIERPDGSTGIYSVITKPDFALIIPVERDGFYLVQEYRYPLGRRVWAFPQGTLPNRQDAEPARTELLGFLYAFQGTSSQGFNAFAALDLHHGIPRREHEEQDMIHAWFSRQDFIELVAKGDLPDDASLAAYALLTICENKTSNRHDTLAWRSPCAN
jgi:hypothetical protein